MHFPLRRETYRTGCLRIPRRPKLRNRDRITLNHNRLPYICGRGSLMRIRPAVAHIHRYGVTLHLKREYESRLGIMCQRTFRTEQPPFLPRASDRGRWEIIVVIAFPACQIGGQEIIGTVFLKHGGTLPHPLHISHLFGYRTVVIA